MTLLEMQRRMSEDVRRPLTHRFEMQRETEDGGSIRAIAESYIKPNEQLSSFERLEIYNRQYWFRVIAAVSEDYPALGAVLGEKKFDALVLEYLKETPSRSYTLRDLSGRLPMWLEDHPEFGPARHELLLDVARLEWAYVEAYDKASLTPLVAEDFGELNAESKLSLQPHLQLLDLKYPVDELVLAVHQETPPSEVASNAVTERRQAARVKLPPMRRRAIYLAVHRFENSVYYRRIEREGWLMLSALQRHRTVGEAIESAFEGSTLSPEEQAAKIQATFAHAAELGWFCKQYVDPALQ